MISPRGDLLAIITSHTVHIAILPDPSHLGQPDTGPLKLKTDMLGPTTHVTSQAPIASALWHPLGVLGMSLVTVTTDAVVRVWEINRENRWSFESPTLAIDLRKLADGVSADEDFGPPKPDMNRGFSPDSVDMEVAAASFGGSGLDEEHGWASMTLWIAMRAGDVYALCPLLPTKWQPPPTLIPSLSTSVVSKTASMQDDVSTSAEDRQHCDQQYQWFSEIDNQDPIVKPADSEFAPPIEIFKRPSHPGPIPKLQGPFDIEIDESGDDIELTDIHVIGAKLDDEELALFNEDESELGDPSQSGLSLAVVNLLTKGGRVHVCLDVDGVEGQWLPKRKVSLTASDYGYRTLSDDLLVAQDKSPRDQDLDPLPSLVVLESIDTMRPADHSDTSWPMFSADVQSRYSFFVTHPQGVSYLSLTQWTERLEAELNSSASTGAAFRIEVVTEGSRTLREQLLYLGSGHGKEDVQSDPFVGCIVLQDSDLGYFLLTAADEQPYAITFDLADSELPQDVDGLHESEYEPDMKMLAIGPPRAAYQPPASLWSQSALSNFLDARVHSRHKKTLKEEIRLSAATLDLMTEAHRILSHETHQLGIAAADLFRRCERLQDEFRDQIKRANELAYRIEQVAGEDADDYDESNRDLPRGSAALGQRLEAARTRQDELVQRHADLRTKLAKSCGRELSDKEQVWAWEIRKLEGSVFDTANKRDQDDANGNRNKPTEPWRRYEEVGLQGQAPCEDDSLTSFR